MTQAKLSSMLDALALILDGNDELPLDEEWPSLGVKMPRGRARRVAFVTKIHTLMSSGLAQTNVLDDVLVTHRYGLLEVGRYQSLIRYLQSMASDPIIRFAGDVDPLDLTTFALLEAAGFSAIWLTSGSVLNRYLGNADALEAAAVMLTPFERTHRDLLGEIIDVETVVGPVLWRLLASGRKLELEGLCNLAKKVDGGQHLLTELFRSE